MSWEQFFSFLKTQTTSAVCAQAQRSIPSRLQVILRTESEIHLLLPQGFGKGLQIELYLTDMDWYCPCPSRQDPCLHVLQSAFFYERGVKNHLFDFKGDSGASSSKIIEFPIQYEFRSQEVLKTLVFSRWKAGEKKTPLLGPLLSWESGKIKQHVAAYLPQDLKVDRLLGKIGKWEGVLPLWKLLPLLENHGGVWVDGAHVHIKTELMRFELKLSPLKDGWSVKIQRPFLKGVLYQNGAYLVEKVLYPFYVPTWTLKEKYFLFQKKEILPREKVFFFQTLLPFLEEKCTVLIEKKDFKKIPKKSLSLPYLKVLFKKEEKISTSTRKPNKFEAEKILCEPKILYGDPPFAQVRGKEIQVLNPQVFSQRNFFEEQKCMEQWQKISGILSNDSIWILKEQAYVLFEKLKNARIPCYGLDVKKLEFQKWGKKDEQQVFAVFSSKESVSFEKLLQAFLNQERYVHIRDHIIGQIPLELLKPFQSLLNEWWERKKSFSEKEQKKFRSELKWFPFLKTLFLSHTFQTQVFKSTSVPVELWNTLRAYQKKGVAWLRTRLLKEGFALLADQMGLGKTLQALGVFERGEKTLILCPKTVLSVWETHLKKFRPDLVVQVLNSSKKIQILKKTPVSENAVYLTSFSLFREHAWFFQVPFWNLVVIDEAQWIRNPKTQLQKSLRKIRSEKRLALTGTPLENRLEDLWSVCAFLEPSFLGSWKHFQKHVVRPFLEGESTSLLHFKKRFETVFLRRTKEQVLKELPPKTEVVLKLSFSEKENTFYQNLRKDLSSQIQKALSTHRMAKALQLLLRLRQSCVCPKLVEPAWDGDETKFEYLMEKLPILLEEGRSVIVFSQWVKALDLLWEKLKAKNIHALRLDGSTQDREKVVQAFQKGVGPQVLLGSLKAAGVGVTLHRADDVFFLDPWWNPMSEQQAMDRVHRIGQKKPVWVYWLVMEHSVEEKVLQLQERKKSLWKIMFDETLVFSKKKSVSDEKFVSISKEDVLNLIQS